MTKTPKVERRAIIGGREYILDNKTILPVRCPFCLKELNVHKWRFIARGAECGCGAFLSYREGATKVT